MLHLLLEILANSIFLAPTGHKVLRVFGIEARKDDPFAIAAGVFVWACIIAGAVFFVIWIFSK
jgi:hypothetical protein